jgi:hypothetical protein
VQPEDKTEESLETVENVRWFRDHEIAGFSPKNPAMSASKSLDI